MRPSLPVPFPSGPCPVQMDFRSFLKVIWEGNWANWEKVNFHTTFTFLSCLGRLRARVPFADKWVANEEEARIMIRLLIAGEHQPKLRKGKGSGISIDWIFRVYVNNGDYTIAEIPVYRWSAFVGISLAHKRLEGEWLVFFSFSLKLVHVRLLIKRKNDFSLFAAILIRGRDRQPKGIYEPKRKSTEDELLKLWHIIPGNGNRAYVYNEETGGITWITTIHWVRNFYPLQSVKFFLCWKILRYLFLLSVTSSVQMGKTCLV